MLKGYKNNFLFFLEIKGNHQTQKPGGNMKLHKAAIPHVSSIFEALCCIIGILLLLSGCASTRKADLPVYERMDKASAGSSLTFDMPFSPYWYNRYAKVSVDGFAVNQYMYLPKGKTTIDLDPGNHQLQLYIEKRQYDIQSLPSEPMEFKFNTAPGKEYVIHIKKDYGFAKASFKFSYEGWNEDESAGFPLQFP